MHIFAVLTEEGEYSDAHSRISIYKSAFKQVSNIHMVAVHKPMPKNEIAPNNKNKTKTKSKSKKAVKTATAAASSSSSSSNNNNNNQQQEQQQQEEPTFETICGTSHDKWLDFLNTLPPIVDSLILYHADIVLSRNLTNFPRQHLYYDLQWGVAVTLRHVEFTLPHVRTLFIKWCRPTATFVVFSSLVMPAEVFAQHSVVDYHVKRKESNLPRLESFTTSSDWFTFVAPALVKCKALNAPLFLWLFNTPLSPAQQQLAGSTAREIEGNGGSTSSTTSSSWSSKAPADCDDGILRTINVSHVNNGNVPFIYPRDCRRYSLTVSKSCLSYDSFAPDENHDQDDDTTTTTTTATTTKNRSGGIESLKVIDSMMQADTTYRLPKLRHLELVNVKHFDAGYLCYYHSSLINMPNIERVIIINSSLFDMTACIPSIMDSASSGGCNLKSIIVRNCKFQNDSGEFSINSDTLEELIFDQCQLVSNSRYQKPACFAAINCPKLRTLQLCDYAFAYDKSILAVLAASSCSSSLVHLNLSGCRLTVNQVLDLDRFPALRRIDFTGTNAKIQFKSFGARDDLEVRLSSTSSVVSSAQLREVVLLAACAGSRGEKAASAATATNKFISLSTLRTQLRKLPTTTTTTTTTATATATATTAASTGATSGINNNDNSDDDDDAAQ